VQSEDKKYMNKIEQLYFILKSNGVSVEKFIKYLNEHVEEVKAF
jgi:hypothetical protein